MPDESINGSEYNQLSFVGGMNLLLDDTHLEPNQYRVGFNVRNRYDRLDPALSSELDHNLPLGTYGNVIQELVTFGNYLIIFISGEAFYKFYTNSYWTKIMGFKMDSSVPRYWTEAIPVSTTNYLRIASTSTIDSQKFPNGQGPINVNNVAGAAAGNLPGLLVQDNINQPQFIFLDGSGFPVVRTTQSFSQWHITFTDATNVTVAPNGDQREYVPIGNEMKYLDGILYITSQDFSYIYRSVSGRPLDFVINVTNKLADGTTTIPFTQYGGGDATTTGYSVGVGGITTLRELSNQSLFVAASNANFSVAKNLSNNAPFIFGEYTFLRTFLFNAVCLSDRCIIDSLGDTRFISLTGIRSFNAVMQTNNEGRNTPFTASIRSAFGSENNPIVQDASKAAAILYNDYEFYAVNTIWGPAIAVYDTINQCWSSFDVNQVGGKFIKQFAKIELTTQALFAVTEDNKIYRLYVGPGNDTPVVRTVGICSNILYANQNVKMANPRKEIQPRDFRFILNNIKEDCDYNVQLYINNRLSSTGMLIDEITYTNPPTPSTDPFKLDDVDTLLRNVLVSTPKAEQGWKVFYILSWSNGSLTQFSAAMKDLTPMNPLRSQKPKSYKNLSNQSGNAQGPAGPPISPEENLLLIDDSGNKIKDDEDDHIIVS